MYPLAILSLGHWAVILRGSYNIHPSLRFNSNTVEYLDIIVTHAIWFQPMETCVRPSLPFLPYLFPRLILLATSGRRLDIQLLARSHVHLQYVLSLPCEY